MTEARVCPVCGKEFEATTHNKRYCSSKCKNQMKIRVRRQRRPPMREEIPTRKFRCEWCGAIIRAYRRVRWCSRRCRLAAPRLRSFFKLIERELRPSLVKGLTPDQLEWVRLRSSENRAWMLENGYLEA